MDSLNATLELFRQGNSMPEIAFKRKLAFSTIEDHLRVLIEKGLVKIEELVPKERMELIKNLLPENPEKLSKIKGKLPASVSYAEIKWILTALGKFKTKPKSSQIQKAINTFVGNHCYRKCFNHEEIIDKCNEEFEQLAKNFSGEITLSEFFRLMLSGNIKICKLPSKKRKQIVFWKQFERLQDNNTDFWDLP